MTTRCSSCTSLVRPQSFASQEAADEVRSRFELARTAVCIRELPREDTHAVYFRMGKDEPDLHFEKCETEGPEPWTALDAGFDAL